MKDCIICLVGPSGTGKTSIAYALKEKYGYNIIESYTTRPPRHEGEKGHTFVDKFNYLFDGKVLPDNVIAFNKYNNYEYWATREQYQGKGVSIYVVDVPGVKMLKETIKDAEIVVVALYVSEGKIVRRLFEREKIFSPKSKKAKSEALLSLSGRVLHDQDAFAIIPCDYCVNANDELEDVVERVNSIIQNHCQR